MKAYVPNLMYNRIIVPKNTPGDNQNEKSESAGKNAPPPVLLGLKVSRTLLKNDDTLLEFRRMWRFWTGAEVLDHVLDVFL